jgi:hypothetical protein
MSMLPRAGEVQKGLLTIPANGLLRSLFVIIVFLNYV